MIAGPTLERSDEPSFAFTRPAGIVRIRYFRSHLPESTGWIGNLFIPPDVDPRSKVSTPCCAGPHISISHNNWLCSVLSRARAGDHSLCCVRTDPPTRSRNRSACGRYHGGDLPIRVVGSVSRLPRYREFLYSDRYYTLMGVRQRRRKQSQRQPRTSISGPPDSDPWRRQV